MKGIRFYLEFSSHIIKHKSGKTNTGHSGNVLAVFVEPDGRPHWHSDQRIPGGCYEVLGAMYEEPNSPVASCSVGVRDVLQKKYKRISETIARKIHPALCIRLDEDEQREEPPCTKPR